MTLLVTPVGALVAANAYLRAELDALNNPLPVGVTPSKGNPTSYALLSRPGTSGSQLMADHMVRVRVFDADAVVCQRNSDLIWALMMAANHRKITTPEGDVWITAATNHTGPVDLDDDDVPLFGSQCAVFWTIATKPV